jgi:hypothetical protein
MYRDETGTARVSLKRYGRTTEARAKKPPLFFVKK